MKDIDGARASSDRGLNVKERDNSPVVKTSDSSVVKILKSEKGLVILQLADGSTIKRTGGTLAWRNNNPGNLKYGPFARDTGAIGPGQGYHAVYPTYESGRNAKKLLLFSDKRGYNNMTILAAIKKYAPVSDGNDPVRYTNYICKKIGSKNSVKLKDLSDKQKEKMLDAMEVFEGFKKGTEVNV